MTKTTVKFPVQPKFKVIKLSSKKLKILGPISVKDANALIAKGFTLVF